MNGLKELSSQWTFWLKYINPCILFLGVPFAYALYVGFFSIPITNFAIACYITWLFLAMFYTVMFYDIKRVSLEKDFLYVSNFEKDEKITLDFVDNVIEKNMGMWGRRITVLFNKETEFGKSISFIANPPPVNLDDQRIQHPVINEIKVAADEYKYYISFAEQQKQREEKEDVFGYF